MNTETANYDISDDFKLKKKLLVMIYAKKVRRYKDEQPNLYSYFNLMKGAIYFEKAKTV